VQSESALAIRLGRQSALIQLGHALGINRTSKASVSMHHLVPKQGKQSPEERGFSAEYLHLLVH
jgi:hypothetical protein